MIIVNLFETTTFGSIDVSNRLVMAPLTRTRTDVDGVPTDLHVEHYAQRAGFGLIVTEGTWPVLEGRTWLGQPGITTDAQIEGWRRVAQGVHDRGGRIVMQLMHGGRIAHPSVSGGRVVAPSAVAAPGEIRTADGKAPLPVPDAMTDADIARVVDAFRRAARHAVEAGLDGVEVHGANGYLVHEFLATASNRRTDAYGGSIENRVRFAVEVVSAVAAEIGAGRTGIRLSPSHNIQGVVETDTADVLATYQALAARLAPLGLAFVDVLHVEPTCELVQTIRARSGAPLIANTGFGVQTTRGTAAELVASGTAEAAAVGRAALANPDLPLRWARGAAENTPDESTFYVGGARGYVDYPTLPAAV